MAAFARRQRAQPPAGEARVAAAFYSGFAGSSTAGSGASSSGVTSRGAPGMARPAKRGEDCHVDEETLRMLPQTVMARVASVSEVLMSKVLMSKVPRSEAPASGLLLLRCGGAKAGRET